MANIDKNKAKEILQKKIANFDKEKDPQIVMDNWDKIYEKLKSNSIFAKLLDEVIDLYNMLKDYLSGEYNEVPIGTIAAIVVALLYVLSPIDVIPDIIPIAGLLDDALVLTICLEFVGSDLEKYRAWKKQQK